MVVAALLSACSVKPDTTDSLPTQTIEEREEALKAFKPWRALGSIAVESVKEGKLNATFAWDVDKQGFEIKLFGPLGVQAVHLSQDKNGASIIDRNGTLEGENAESLLEQALGTLVPISQMQYWAVGLPGNGSSLQRDDVGRLQSMVVKDSNNVSWDVDFKRYTTLESLYLPKEIFVAGEGVMINLIFKKWSRGEPAADNGRLSIPGVSS